MSFSLFRFVAWVIAGCLLVSQGVAGERVLALQQPVWVETSEGRSAAFPGQALDAAARIVTGETGKAHLRLPEGSVVKLGVNTELAFESQGVDAARATEAAPEGLYQGTLRVLEGAFRFTTGALGARFSREMDIQVGPLATIGIRGTDVWGRASPDSSFVALIEGDISITRQDGSQVRLTEPLSVFSASANEPAGDVVRVQLEDVLALAPETELDDGKGVLIEGGAFVVHLASFPSQAQARQRVSALRQQGYAVSDNRADAAGAIWYRVSVVGFASLADARAFADTAKAAGLSRTPWVDNR